MPRRRSAKASAERLREGAAIAIVCVVAAGGAIAAQPAPAAPALPGPAPAATVAGITVEPSDEPSTLVFFNRPIVSLRAQVMGRRPIERTAVAVRVLDELVAEGSTESIELRRFDFGVVVQMGTRGVLALTSLDIDELSGETLDEVGQRTVAHLRQAVNEAREARAPGVLLRAVAIAVLALAVTVSLLWAIAWARRAVAGVLITAAERTVAKSRIADLDLLRRSRLLDFQKGLASAVFLGLGLVVSYVGLTYTLRQFPYTRPWGESMRGFLLATAGNLGSSMLLAIPGLVTVVLIAVIARFAARLIRLWFDAVERGRIRARWIYPETAQPTRRLLTAGVWLVAVVMAYPYLPGSDTEAFKGVSVFVGLIVTLGSSGLVNQLMSGLMIIYSRALRLGDFVRAGDVEGTVLHLGVLSTKIRTVFGEEVTVPNAVIIAQTITDYSRTAGAQAVFTPTSVTIGYDAPWRQVQALLLLAAERTSGLRRQPAPFVVQASLDDYYVKYTLLTALEDQQARLHTLHALHANIQDLFNEYGVQIMSPNYVLDPAAPKVVAKQDWFAAPAQPPSHDIGTIHSTASSSAGFGARPGE